MTNRDIVVLVNEAGIPYGTAKKLAAHEPPGQLHLAFSVVLFGSDGRILLQQRAASKYHFPLMWANACCSHPAPSEDALTSATQRVVEELGVKSELQPAGDFVYRAICPTTGRVEYEFDQVFVGTIAADPVPNREEVEAVRWASAEQLVELERSGVTVPWLADAVRLAEVTRQATQDEPAE